MRNMFQFGRRLTLPSTVQIKHELTMLIAAERVATLEIRDSRCERNRCRNTGII